MEIKDGEKLPLAVKDMGSCEVFPHAVVHSPNGRLASLCKKLQMYTYVAMLYTFLHLFSKELCILWLADSMSIVLTTLSYIYILFILQFEKQVTI